jgi:hypothetical protein
MGAGCPGRVIQIAERVESIHVPVAVVVVDVTVDAAVPVGSVALVTSLVFMVWMGFVGFIPVLP